MGQHESWCKNCVVDSALTEKQLATNRSEKGIIKPGSTTNRVTQGLIMVQNLFNIFITFHADTKTKGYLIKFISNTTWSRPQHDTEVTGGIWRWTTLKQADRLKEEQKLVLL